VPIRGAENCGMWRNAQPEDDDSVVEMCLQLFSEDPGPLPVAGENMRATLAFLRRDPGRGRAVVLDICGKLSGYALLISFWSNELGGQICEVDELFVAPEYRNRGFGTSLFAAIERGDLWPAPTSAIVLGVTPDNAAARRLYERLGFAAAGVAMVRRLPQEREMTAVLEGK
jgi:ribosomal protein S18 acetylase RimI-like enzyme